MVARGNEGNVWGKSPRPKEAVAFLIIRKFVLFGAMITVGMGQNWKYTYIFLFLFQQVDLYTTFINYF